MNKFEYNFFKKYVPEDEQLMHVIHVHTIEIINKVIARLVLWVWIPCFFYYNSIMLKEVIPFIAFEVILFLLFLRIVYVIFDWYNDVFILTDLTLYQLNWKLTKKTLDSIPFEKIHLIEVEENWQMDKTFKKWDLIIHRLEEETLVKRDLPEKLVLKSTPHPFDSADKIEELYNEIELEEDHRDLKYDVIMDALWWVVENYLEWKGQWYTENNIDSWYLGNVEKQDWTIDLR